MSTESVIILELIEAEAWARHQLASPPSIRERFGIQVTRIAGAVVLIGRGCDMLGMNKVIGLGLAPSTDPDVIDELIALYDGFGVRRFLVQWSPTGDPAIRERLARRGFRCVSRMAKMRRSTADDVEVPPGIDVRTIGRDAAALYGEVVASGHGDPPELAAAHAATVGDANWRHYLALADGRPTAGATLFHCDRAAWCGFGATIPDGRRRGAHAALLSRRVADARILGCEIAVCETAEETQDRPNPAYRNMRRAGFEVAYLRENLVYAG